jgi:hypothetical protein
MKIYALVFLLILTFSIRPAFAACAFNIPPPPYQDSNRDTWCADHNWNSAYKFWFTASQWMQLVNQNGTVAGTLTLYESTWDCDQRLANWVNVPPAVTYANEGILYEHQQFQIGQRDIVFGTTFVRDSTYMDGCYRSQPSPIFIAFDNNLDLTSAEQGVDFDLESSGRPLRLGWTKKKGKQAWLVRPTDGVVVNGSNLFGNLNPQAPEIESGESENGYRALRLLDLNSDMQISAAEADVQGLALWFDDNHDGLSSPTELVPFSSRLSSFDLKYKVSNRRDENDNKLRYRGEATTVNGSKVQTFDVYPVVGSL